MQILCLSFPHTKWRHVDKSPQAGRGMVNIFSSTRVFLIPERGTKNGEPGTGVWERVHSGNPYKNSKWWTISFPESTGSTISGWSPGETLGKWNFLPTNSWVPVVCTCLAIKTEVNKSKKPEAQGSV